MLASRLTADCIWNSFHNSNKRHLIITGGKGSGKSTLLSQLFLCNIPGITTRAEKGRAVFIRNNITGEEMQIGVFDSNLPGNENKMLLKKDGFISVGVPTLRYCAECSSQWITIDEVGYLEEGCIEYQRQLLKLMDKKQVAAVVRKQNLPFVTKLCSRDDVFIVDLDNPFGSIGCVIMASGMGKRFGANKLMADFFGKPMISRVLDATKDVFTERIVITRHNDVASVCEAAGVSTVLHNGPYLSDTIRLGIENISDVRRCMFVTADQPLLSQNTVQSLALSSKNAPFSIWRAAHNGTVGSPVIFPAGYFDELLCLSYDNGGNEIIKKHPEALRLYNVENEFELMDVDSQEDLIKLSAIL